MHVEREGRPGRMPPVPAIHSPVHGSIPQHSDAWDRRAPQTAPGLARLIVGQRDIVPFHIDWSQGRKARWLDEAGPTRAPPLHRRLGIRACAAASRPFGTRPSNSARAGTGRRSARRPASGRTSGTAAARGARVHRLTWVGREVRWLRTEQGSLARRGVKPMKAAAGKFPRNSVGGSGWSSPLGTFANQVHWHGQTRFPCADSSVTGH